MSDSTAKHNDVIPSTVFTNLTFAKTTNKVSKEKEWYVIHDGVMYTIHEGATWWQMASILHSWLDSAKKEGYADGQRVLREQFKTLLKIE